MKTKYDELEDIIKCKKEIKLFIEEKFFPFFEDKFTSFLFGKNTNNPSIILSKIAGAIKLTDNEFECPFRFSIVFDSPIEFNEVLIAKGNRQGLNLPESIEIKNHSQYFDSNESIDCYDILFKKIKTQFLGENF